MKDFRDRLRANTDAGTIHDRDIRYLMIRPDSLMGLFRILDPGKRELALGAFSDSVKMHGKNSAESYQQLGVSEAGSLLASISETASQLGWGKWSFDTDFENQILHLTVMNSPFVEGFGPSDTTICAPIVGMIAGVAELIFGKDAEGWENRCAACGDEQCLFEARAES
tara:strand:+ start:58 stop:561 length:504 start_codon:yes stop_codon:yes gene_type:complete